MVEQLNRIGQEEFIWAMRKKALNASEDDTEQFRSTKPSFISCEELIDKPDVFEKGYNENQIKTLSSFLSDDTIENYNNYSQRTHECCLLFAKISGFINLYLKYRKSGNSTSSLVQELNTYLGMIMHEIISHQGDVLKLYDGKLLAIWKRSQQNMHLSISRALDCAIKIIKQQGIWKTEIGTILETTIVISAGEIVLSLIGDENISQYVEYGKPILEIKNLKDYANPNEIIVAESAWAYVTQHDFKFELHSENTFAKVFGYSEKWKDLQHIFTKKNFEGRQSSITSEMEHQGEALDKRSNINKSFKLSLKKDLGKFIAPPIVEVVETNEVVDFLTELRQIVSLHINIVLAKSNVYEYLIWVNNIFKHLVRIVSRMGGYIKSVCLFVKDLIFEVLFGLKGFTHKLESRIALECAEACFKRLSKIPDISVSVAVTTGLTFCGVVGHAVRREYVLIGLGVKRATALLNTYNGILACDRETFLQSKLETNYFVPLSSLIILGGIRTGPNYQYIGFSGVAHISSEIINNYPILDRDDEVRMYLKLLETKLDQNKANDTEAFVVYGHAREGKSRLLEELLYITPKEIPKFFIKLLENDKTHLYRVIYLLFLLPLDLESKKDDIDVERKLFNALRKMPVPELFCLLNGVFGTKFKNTPIFYSLTKEQRQIALCKVIKQLCYGSFQDMWVICIDGGEHIGDESWPLINAVMESRRVILLISICLDANLSSAASHVLHLKTIKSVRLRPIDKWYQVGLACQFLNVLGIPPELEKSLHSKSNGNPGWIESYLKSLLHDKCLWVRNVATKHVDQYGLVISPEEMISREVNVHTNTRKSRSRKRHYIDNVLEKWRIYKHTFKEEGGESQYKNEGNEPGESNILLDINPELEPQLSKMDQNVDIGTKEVMSQVSQLGMDSRVNICLVNPNINIGDVEPELSSLGIAMKLVDCLSSFELLILKCMSVIGDVAPREMLHQLLNANEYATALGVMRLFEFGILGCAKGNFEYEDNNAILNAPTINLFADDKVECKCIGLRIQESCDQLPKYASCGYLYFKMTNFRDTCYNFLTQIQRLDFHTKALKYLEKRTRKCKSCGSGTFSSLMGQKLNQDFKQFKQKRTIEAVMSSASQKEHLKSIVSYKSQDSSKHFKSFYEAESARRSTLYKNLKDNYDRLSLISTYSELDFMNCECGRILTCMYNQVMHHAIAINRIDKWMDAILEYSNLCIDASNLTLAVHLLTQALEVLEEKYKIIINAMEVWRRPILKAKLLVLLGRVHIKLEESEKAYDNLIVALKCYGYTFPSKVSLKTINLRLQYLLIFNCYSRFGIGNKTGSTAEFCTDLSDCLTQFSILFMKLEMYENAEIAAMWSLKKALEAESDFYTIIAAFANLIEVHLMCEKTDLFLHLEVRSLMYCKLYTNICDLKEMHIICHLYSVIFKARVVMMRLYKATEIGFVVLRMFNSLSLKFYQYNIFPLFVHILIVQYLVQEAIKIIASLEASIHQETYFYGTTWFYALCATIQLDTCYNFIPYEQFETQGVRDPYCSNCEEDTSAVKRYYTCMWLWCVRLRNFEDVDMWEEKMRHEPIFTRKESLVNLITAVYFLEGLILQLASAMDQKDILTVQRLDAEIGETFSLLFCQPKRLKIIEPRIYHLKAFYAITKSNNHEAFALLKMARKLAKKTENIYDENWIDHSEMAWKHLLSKADKNFWRDHTTEDLRSYREATLTSEVNVGYFTLQPPLFV